MKNRNDTLDMRMDAFDPLEVSNIADSEPTYEPRTINQNLYLGQDALNLTLRTIEPATWSQIFNIKLDKHTLDGRRTEYSYDLKDDQTCQMDTLNTIALDLNFEGVQLKPTDPTLDLLATGMIEEIGVYYYISQPSDLLQTGKVYIIVDKTNANPLLPKLEALNAGIVPSGVKKAYNFSPRRRVRWGQYAPIALLDNYCFSSGQFVIEEFNDLGAYMKLSTWSYNKYVMLYGARGSDNYTYANVSTYQDANLVEGANVYMPEMRRVLTLPTGASRAFASPEHIRGRKDSVYPIFSLKCPTLNLRFIEDVKQLLVLSEQKSVDVSNANFEFLVLQTSGADAPLSAPLELFTSPSSSVLVNQSQFTNSIHNSTNGIKYFWTSTPEVTYTVGSVETTLQNPKGIQIGIEAIGPQGENEWRDIIKPGKYQSAQNVAPLNLNDWFVDPQNIHVTFQPVLWAGKLTESDKEYYLKDCASLNLPFETTISSSKHMANANEDVNPKITVNEEYYIKYGFVYARNWQSYQAGDRFNFNRTTGKAIIDLHYPDFDIDNAGLKGSISIKLGTEEDTNNTLENIKFSQEPMFLVAPSEDNFFLSPQFGYSQNSLNAEPALIPLPRNSCKECPNLSIEARLRTNTNVDNQTTTYEVGMILVSERVISVNSKINLVKVPS